MNANMTQRVRILLNELDNADLDDVELIVGDLDEAIKLLTAERAKYVQPVVNP